MKLYCTEVVSVSLVSRSIQVEAAQDLGVAIMKVGARSINTY